MKHFTKIAALGLTAVCLTGCLAACAKNPNAETKNTDPAKAEQRQEEDLINDKGMMTGGWTAAKSNAVTEQQMKYFREAVALINGYFYEPVALVGTQVVSGVNYCFLCKTTVDQQNGVGTLKYTYIYVNTEGDARFMGDKNVTIPGSSVTQKLGGYSYASNPEITADIQKIVDKAAAKRLGTEYTPIAYLGSQVVAGKNHAILCRTTPVTADPNAAGSLVIVTIYEDLQGNCEITGTTNVSLNF